MFQRDGNDLHMTYKIGLVEALCGFQFTFKHLDGRQIVVKYPPGKVIEPGKSWFWLIQGMCSFRICKFFCNRWLTLHRIFIIEHLSSWIGFLVLSPLLTYIQGVSVWFEGKACHSTATPLRKVIFTSSLTCSFRKTTGSTRTSFPWVFSEFAQHTTYDGSCFFSSYT